jgi:hypothetical protein
MGTVGEAFRWGPYPVLWAAYSSTVWLRAPKALSTSSLAQIHDMSSYYAELGNSTTHPLCVVSPKAALILGKNLALA